MFLDLDGNEGLQSAVELRVTKYHAMDLQCSIQQDPAFQGSAKLHYYYTRKDLEQIRNNYAATDPQIDDSPAYHQCRICSNNLL
ncbi:unnamed protein product [Dovyalis caffra]|uniref:Uncharacterized protein n=1 Tax=Dovyalis caffra TaxID=77055 RepID=A0AAV1S0L7_9ROSI|nr:unnamed protein product [Dovyalis caffra]